MHIFFEYHFTRVVSFASRSGIRWNEWHFSLVEYLISCCLCRDGKVLGTLVEKKRLPWSYFIFLKLFGLQEKQKIHQSKTYILEEVRK